MIGCRRNAMATSIGISFNLVQITIHLVPEMAAANLQSQIEKYNGGYISFK